MQADALYNIIELVKNTHNIGVIIFTGNGYRELTESEHNKKMYEFCKFVIDRVYYEDYNSKKSLRDSSNQQVISIMERYRKDLGLYGLDGYAIEIIICDIGTASMIGIPLSGMVI